MTTITVEKELGTFQQMDLLDQYRKGKINVTITHKDGNVKNIGTIVSLVPGKKYKAVVAYSGGVRSLKPHELKGFNFVSSNGRYSLNKVLS